MTHVPILAVKFAATWSTTVPAPCRCLQALANTDIATVCVTGNKVPSDGQMGSQDSQDMQLTYLQRCAGNRAACSWVSVQVTGYAWGVVKRHWHDLITTYLFLIYACDMSYACVWYDSSICVCHDWTLGVTCLILHVCHESFTCVTCWMLICSGTHSKVWNDLLIPVTCRIHRCDMTNSYEWQDSFICLTWPIYLYFDWFICVTWLTHVYVRSHSHAKRDSFICVTCLIHSYDMSHSHVWHDSVILEQDLFIFVPRLVHTARKASWKWVFDPYAPLLFNFYHHLEQNLHLD